MHSPRWLGLILTALSAAACTESAVQPGVPPLSAVLTPQAAAGLKPDGRFALAQAPNGEMTGGDAIAIAVLYNRMFGRALEAAWQRERHGAAINVDQLKPCGSPEYARSPNKELPATVGNATRQLFGPYWLTTLCGQAGDPEVSIALPAADTALRIEAGKLVGVSDAQVIPIGIPAGHPGVPPSPEEAAEAVAAATGRRVASVPELVAASSPQAPQLSRWRMVLESSINAKGLVDGQAHTLSEIYYGYGDTWKALQLLTVQSAPQEVFKDPTRGGAPVTVSVVPGYAHRYQPITVVH